MRNALQKTSLHLVVNEDDAVVSNEASEALAPGDLAAFTIPLDRIVVDLETLRNLRMSEAATTVAAAALGDELLPTLRKKKGGWKAAQYVINPYDLHFESSKRDFNTPLNRKQVSVLADSIVDQGGIVTPLECYIKGDKVYCNVGETRLRAVLHAINFHNLEVEGVLCVIRTEENDDERIISALINKTGRKFNEIEEARLIGRYINLGADVNKLVKRIGKEPAYITNSMKLLKMPSWLQDKAIAGEMKPHVAYELWLAAGESSDQAVVLLEGANLKAVEENSQRVVAKEVVTIRPRHVKAAAKNDGSSTRVVRKPKVNVVAIFAKHFNQHGRPQIEQWFGKDAAGEMFDAIGKS